MLIEKVGKELELKKHVGSIHCSNSLSLLQRKISNVLLYHAFDELLVQEEHSITIKTLCTMISYSSHDYDSIKKALRALISTIIEWNLLGENKERQEEDWNASSMLASVGFRNGICTYSYSSHLKKLLYMPEMYGRINIAIQAKFKSNYGLALYENCVRYQNLPHTRWFPLITFRKLMGVPDHKYVVFRDFKRRVLDKSVEEVNLYADINVEPEIERQGHQVNRIRFKLTKVSKDAQLASVMAVVPEQEGQGAILTMLVDEFGFSHVHASKTLKQFAPDYIHEKIAIVKASAAFKAKRILNSAAYLTRALNDDYVAPSKIAAVPLVKTYQPDNQEQDLYAQYQQYESDKVDRTYEQLPEAQQVKLLTEFEHYLTQTKNQFVFGKYNERGLSNRIVGSIFRNFLRLHYTALLPTPFSFEEFLAERGDHCVEE